MQGGPSWEVQETTLAAPAGESTWAPAKLKFALGVPLASLGIVLVSVFYLLWFEAQTRQQEMSGAMEQKDELDFTNVKPDSAHPLMEKVSMQGRDLMLYQSDLQAVLRTTTIVGAHYEAALSDDIKKLISAIMQESVRQKLTFVSIGVDAAPLALAHNHVLTRFALMESVRKEFIQQGILPERIFTFQTATAPGLNSIDQAGRELEQRNPRLMITIGRSPLNLSVIKAWEQAL